VTVLPPPGSGAAAVVAKRARGKRPADTIASMPDPEGDLEGRGREREREVARLKDGVEISRADAAAARLLAGGADRDVSDVKTLLRAHTQTLNSLRETQLEQQDKLTSLDEKLDVRTTSLQAQIDGLRSEMQRGFGMLQTGIAQIVAGLPDRNSDDQPD
jgi:chromosome segregation ATPase